MDWKDDEVNRRLNSGNNHFCTVQDVMREGEAIRRDLDREEESRTLEKENNTILKNQLSEAHKANLILENQNKELKEANKKLETQIKDFKEDVKNSKKQAIVSSVIAIVSILLTIVSIVLSVVLK